MRRKVTFYGDEGRNVAVERYGQPTQSIEPPSASPEPQDRESRRAGSGDVRQSWVTGANGDGRPPHFDQGRR